MKCAAARVKPFGQPLDLPVEADTDGVAVPAQLGGHLVVGKAERVILKDAPRPFVHVFDNLLQQNAAVGFLGGKAERACCDGCGQPVCFHFAMTVLLLQFVQQQALPGAIEISGQVRQFSPCLIAPPRDERTGFHQQTLTCRRIVEGLPRAAFSLRPEGECGGVDFAVYRTELVGVGLLFKQQAQRKRAVSAQTLRLWMVVDDTVRDLPDAARRPNTRSAGRRWLSELAELG